MTDLPIIKLMDEDENSMNFELSDEAYKMCAEFGLRLVVTCAAFGLDIDDAFKAVVDRGQYLSQEPEENNDD
jgi:hypothetical protein